MTGLTFEIRKYFGQFVWDLKHQNGTLLVSSRTYTRKRDAKRAIERFKAKASDLRIADVKDTTVSPR